MRRADQAGFTLVEVLVAFAIAAMFLAVTFDLLSGSLAGIGRAEAHDRALAIAESRLEAAGLAEPLVPGATSGRYDERFTWRTEVRPFSRDLYELTVSVLWRQGLGQQSVALHSLRLAARQGAKR
jgi:general secretion pathway protein I